MNKILTISIAAYNDEKYIADVIESLIIPEINNLEILINDDGGTDKTKQIVEKYINQYPNSIKFIHQENGGYGTVLMKNIEIASGKYFKQLDGDDKFNKEGLSKVVKILKENDIEVLYSPYEIYEIKKKEKRIIDVFSSYNEGKYILNDIIEDCNGYMNMHSVCFKTSLLKQTDLKLPRNCLYTDAIYCLEPLYLAKQIYIEHVPVYMYSIGIDGQSIDKKSRVKHFAEHEKICNQLIDFYCNIQNKSNVSNYIKKYISSRISSSIIDYKILLPLGRSNLDVIKKYDMYVLKRNKEIYNQMDSRKSIHWLRKSNYSFLIYFLIKVKYKYRF